MDLATYQRHLFTLLFAPDGAPSVEESVAALANARGTAKRWRRYRQMVRDRLEDVVENSFPRLRAALGATWPALIARWLTESPPTTPYLRDVHGELARWIESALDEIGVRGGSHAAPPWASALARYERALLEVSYAAEEQGARGVDVEVGAFAMERAAVLTPAHQIVRAKWAVHRLGDGGDASAVAPGDFALCVYRDPSSHAVRVLELGAFAAALLEGLARDERRALIEVVREAAAATGEAIDAALVAAFADLVADLMERGVWLGAAPVTDA
jgi:hypothetical protein